MFLIIIHLDGTQLAIWREIVFVTMCRVNILTFFFYIANMWIFFVGFKF